MAKPEAFRRGWAPKFSLCHPSARPSEWKKTRDAWIDAASKPVDAEYVVCFDLGRHRVEPKEAAPARVVYNTGRHCSVDATNAACAAAVGRCLIVISDDILPCPNWDQELTKIGRLWSGQECVVRVKTGGQADARGLLTVQILNRERYERYGYLFHPSYTSMKSDDEFTENAHRDGCIVNAAHILFRHEHWTTGERQMDDVYRAQNAPERYRQGEENFQLRARLGFPVASPKAVEAAA